MDISYTALFVESIVFFIEYSSFFLFQKIDIKIELRILLTFYQKDLHYFLFRYIDRTVVLSDIWIGFVKFLKDPNFPQISGIDVNINLCNNIKSIFKNLQAKSKGNGADSRLLGNVELIVRGEKFIESGEFVSVHHFYLLYSIFPLIIYHLCLLYSILSFNNSIHYIGK